MEDLQHFSHHQHPLVFNENERRGYGCLGCGEDVYGPSYSCKECWDGAELHHKSCAELPLGLHHPLHPKHPLILFGPYRYEEKEFPYENGKCEVCKEVDRYQYSYGCSRCNFNIHIGCTVSPIQAEFHDHPLIPIGKSITFTCDICGKEDKGVPVSCGPCSFLIHRRCASFPRRVKVVRHKHPLHLTHSSHEVDQSDSRICPLCVQKVDTHYGLYYCSTCDFVTHLDCALDWRNRDRDWEKLKDEESSESKATLEIEDTKLGEFADSSAYKVKKTNVGKDGTEIATEIEHFSHEHDLKLSDDEVQNNEICDGCVRAILPPFYSLISDILTHPGHEHQLILSSVRSKHNCSCCGLKISPIFRCTTCDFALDFKCATLPHTTSYKQHEHPFTLCYTAEDDSGEYYCDICEEERDSKHWFYYCEDCSYPAHPKCILGKHPNCTFGGAYTFDCHPHPLTFIEETKDHPLCDKCSRPCEELIYQCAQCNFYRHFDCMY
uniref:Phorbol-ester/DAG-type domain-containing protein n=1 Tax=Fagus sylvatica TaxID=28930 RepID=A0A2N9FQF4_FAGSY